MVNHLTPTNTEKAKAESLPAYREFCNTPSPGVLMVQQILCTPRPKYMYQCKFAIIKQDKNISSNNKINDNTVAPVTSGLTLQLAAHSMDISMLIDKIVHKKM